MGTNKIIATDLDGTLFYPKKRVKMISNESDEFIQRFMDDGGRLLLVSGRNRFFAEKVAERLNRPVDIVGCNGAFVISDGKLIKENFFDVEELSRLLKEAPRDFDIPLIILFTKDRNMVIPRTQVSRSTGLMYNVYEFFQGTYKEAVIRSDKAYFDEIAKGQTYKVLFLFGIAGKAKKSSFAAAKLLELSYPHMEFAWVNQGLEVTPKGCSKDLGISFYLEYNRFSRDNVMVVGDSGNDIPMFEAFYEHSFCMEHSPIEVREHARHVIRRFADLERYVYPSVETERTPRKKKAKAKKEEKKQDESSE